MKLLAAAAAALISVIPVVAAPPPASAAGAITIESPNGIEYRSGSAVTVSGYNSSDWSESFSIECRSGRWDTFQVDPGSFSVSIGSFPGPDACRIFDDYYDHVASFSVAAAPAQVSDASVSASAFYPRVRDGYRDAITFRWSQSNQAPATIRIVDSRGRTVRMADIGLASRRASWRWDGRGRNGSPVAAGRYRIKVNAGRNAVSAPVAVATGTVNRTFAARKEGHVGSFSTGGSCYASRDSYDQIATLDCWGGRFARASYKISLPAGAFDVRGVIDLNRSDLDRCCDGRITKGWSRTSARVVTFWARVTGWRATDVNFVRATYKRRVRI